MRRIAKTSTSCALWIAVSITALSFLLVKGPWAYATWQARARLQQNPNFEEHLDSYSRTGAQWGILLRAVEVADPIIDGMDTLKRFGLWNLFLDFLRVTRPSVAISISLLDEVLRELVTIQDEFAGLAQLSAIADTSRNFRIHSDKQSLRELAELCDEGAAALDKVNQRLGWLVSQVDLVNDTMADVMTALGQAGEDSNSFMHEPARMLLDGLQPAAQAFDQLAGDLGSYQAQVAFDVATIGAIGEVATKARGVDEFLNSTVPFKFAFAVVERLGLALVGLVLLTGLWISFRGDGSIEQPREELAIPSKVVRQPSLSFAATRPPPPKTIKQPSFPEPLESTSPSKRGQLCGKLIEVRTDGRSHTISLVSGAKQPLGSGPDIVIYSAPPRYFVEALDTGHRVYVNNELVDKIRRLWHQDEIRVGNQQLYVFYSGGP